MSAPSIDDVRNALIKLEQGADHDIAMALLKKYAPDLQTLDEEGRQKVFDEAIAILSSRGKMDSLPAHLYGPIMYANGCEVFALDESMRAIDKYGAALGAFVYGNVLVQILPGKLGAEIGALNADAFAARLGRRVTFGKTANGDTRQTACPQKLINAIFNNAAHLRSLTIDRIAYTPIYKSGKLRAGKGFDPEEHVYLDAPDAALPAACDRDAALAARDYLSDWLKEFPFATATDRSVALALLLSAAMRASGIRAPGFLITKPSHGAGASTLADLAHIVLTGRRAPMINAAKSTAEIDKEVDSAQGHGRAALVIDNVPKGSLFNSIATAQVLQQDYRAARILGESRSPIVENTQLVMLTGVNVRVADDLVRRFVKCTLDPNCERPQAKRFDRPSLLDDAVRDRVQLLEACYTIIAAFERNRASNHAEVLAGYEKWCATVAGALVWLGEADPLASQALIEQDDPVTTQLSVLQEAWAVLFGSRAVTSAMLFDAGRNTDLDDLGKPGVEERVAARHSLEELFEDTAVDTRGRSTAQQLGRWLNRHKDRVTGEWKLVRRGAAHNNVASWQFIPVVSEAPSPAQVVPSPKPEIGVNAAAAGWEDEPAPDPTPAATSPAPESITPAVTDTGWMDKPAQPGKVNGGDGVQHDPATELVKRLKVGPNTARDLVQAGYTSCEKIAEAALPELVNVRPQFDAEGVKELQKRARAAIAGAAA